MVVLVLFVGSVVQLSGCFQIVIEQAPLKKRIYGPKGPFYRTVKRSERLRQYI